MRTAGAAHWSSPGGAVQDAEQRSDRKRAPTLQPRVKILPSELVHPDLPAFAALGPADQDRTPAAIEIGLGQRERFADPQPGAPEHHDHAAQPLAVRAIAGGAHHGDDFLDRRRVGGGVDSAVAGWATGMERGRGRW